MMKIRSVLGCLLVACMCLPTAAFAANSVLSGVFDGSEAKLAPLEGNCGGVDPLAYEEAGTFMVSVSGIYNVLDVYHFDGFDIVALIYSGNFNANSPNTNLITPINYAQPSGVDLQADVNLSSGTSYTLVIQQACTDWAGSFHWISRQGTWALSLSGPGTVSSEFKVTDLPSMTHGTINANDPVVETECGDSQHQQSGPVQVSKSGTYYFTDVYLLYDVDICLQVFTAPFDSANPTANRVGGILDDWETIELEAGKDYYFVVQPFDIPDQGEFNYVFAPSAPFGISYGMAGSWYHPSTTGQGFLIDIFDSANLMFLAWFTYDLERPANGVQAMIGDPGHRWMTAVGPFEGDTANLDITWSSGMVFDSETPPVENESDGTITVQFDDCNTGTITYDLGASGATGTVPIERIVNDTVPFCESMTEGPGKPGPL